EHMRKESVSMHFYNNILFYRTENDAILCYGKMTPARDNIIVVVVNLDPRRTQNTHVHIPVEEFGPMDGDTYQVHDLLSDARYVWRGSPNYVELNPNVRPAHI